MAEIKVTLVGSTMRRCRSNPGRVGPPRVVKRMLRWIDLSETDDCRECSYIQFEDSKTIHNRYDYFVPKDEFNNNK